MSTIYVSNLFEMPVHVNQLGVRDLVSIIQPELQPDTPQGVEPGRHHRVGVHDITDARAGGILATEADVARLIEFVDAWTAEAPLLVHCFAGVSRSTAVALIAHVFKTSDPEASAQLLRRQAPHAIPNRRIITLADRAMRLDGALEIAVERMGPPRVAVIEGPLTTLPVLGAATGDHDRRST